MTHNEQERIREELVTDYIKVLGCMDYKKHH